MSIDFIILMLILLSVLTAIYLLLKKNYNKDDISENKEAEEIANLKMK